MLAMTCTETDTIESVISSITGDTDYQADDWLVRPDTTTAPPASEG